VPRFTGTQKSRHPLQSDGFAGWQALNLSQIRLNRLPLFCGSSILARGQRCNYWLSRFRLS